MRPRQGLPFIILGIVLLSCSGCDHMGGKSSLYINGPENYRVRLDTVLQSDERYISILIGSGIGQTHSQAILAAAKNVADQQEALGWDTYDLRLLKQSFKDISDGYECHQLHLVYEKPSDERSLPVNLGRAVSYNLIYEAQYVDNSIGQRA